MKTIYLDSDFKCHIFDDGTMTSVKTDFFDGKCDAYVEGYRIIPAGKSWTRSDGERFTGEMVVPWKDWRELDDAQREYERERYVAMENELAEGQAEADALRQQLSELDTAYAEGVQSV